MRCDPNLPVSPGSGKHRALFSFHERYFRLDRTSRAMFCQLTRIIAQQNARQKWLRQKLELDALTVQATSGDAAAG